ncbi:MAG: RnfABCDGE type electron transport complex subunit G [Alistipes sp.]|jgi:electron transport complex protein RnfG|nr:RnfABCDGE type electron transport complex subunit G [Alistipes sp.]
MKNSLLNMVLVLGGISLVASAGVGFVYKVTKDPIAQAAEANKKAALGEVLPAFDEAVPDSLTLDGLPVIVYTATASGEIVGYAVETATMSGFSGRFDLMVGFEPDGRVRAVKVLQHAETPGLGSKMADAGNVLFASFDGRNPGEMNLAVRKDGGDVDALTAATITSRAYVDAVARAFNAMMESNGLGTGVDAATGATAQAGTGSTAPSVTDSTDTTAQAASEAATAPTKTTESARPQIVSCSIANDGKETKK